MNIPMITMYTLVLYLFLAVYAYCKRLTAWNQRNGEILSYCQLGLVTTVTFALNVCLLPFFIRMLLILVAKRIVI